MTKAKDPEFPSETVREVTLYLTTNEVLRFPLREMELAIVRRVLSDVNSGMTIDYPNCTCVIFSRAVLYFEISKEEYVPEENDRPLPQGIQQLN